jgi:hypothetical protein
MQSTFIEGRQHNASQICVINYIGPNNTCNVTRCFNHIGCGIPQQHCIDAAPDDTGADLFDVRSDASNRVHRIRSECKYKESQGISGCFEMCMRKGGSCGFQTRQDEREREQAVLIYSLIAHKHLCIRHLPKEASTHETLV